MRLPNFLNYIILFFVQMNKCLINGEWVAAKSGESFAVINPATGKVVANVPKISAREVGHAITSAKKGFDLWKDTPKEQRSDVLRKWYSLILENKEDIARTLTSEQGKPLKEAVGEVDYAASFVEWYANETLRDFRENIENPNKNINSYVIKQPIGVVAAITPWNFPAAMITRKVAPAIAAGCSVVLKPAEATPLTALALGVLAMEAGIPKGVLNIVTGDPVEIGKELTSNLLVRKLSFTGSTKTGRLLLAQCADTVKSVSMELGGNAPFIVFADADLEKAVTAAIASRFRNSGQTCICANRILVENSVYNKFSDAMAKKVSELRLGSDLGPLINQVAVSKVEGLIADALGKGAKLKTGGKRHEIGDNFFEPTVVCEVTPNMKIFTDEIFGPVAALTRFSSVDEVIYLANDTEYGLASYIFTSDMSKAKLVSEKLEYGMVGINTTSLSAAFAPFGGMKQSGIGREGGHYGIEEFLEVKYIASSDA